MMKIIVIGLLYNVLLQRNAAGEPTVTVQICSDIFANAITDSLNEIEPNELKKELGDFKTEIPIRNVFFPHAMGKKQSIVIPIRNVQLKNLGRITILSNNSIETRFKTNIVYGEKSFYQIGKKKTQNDYLFLVMDIIATLRFDVKRDKIIYYLKECEINLINYETNLSNNFDPYQGKVRGPTKSNLCRIVRKIIDILNENWKEYLIIDPSGDPNLVLKSISKTNPDCLEFNLNLVIGNSEVISEQKHDVLRGNGISLTKDYICNMLFADIYLTEVNKKLEENNLQLSPDELQGLVPDVFETEQTGLNIMIIEMPKLNFNGKSNTMIVLAKLQGFSSKSDKSIFEVIFEINVKMELLLNNNKVNLQFLSSRGEVIHTSNSNIGESGDLNIENLQKLLEKITSGTLVPILNELHINFRIPFGNFALKVAVTGDC